MIFGEFLKQNNITVYLIIELLINDTKFMLINLYNTNTANRQQRFSGFIQRCLYYIFISQNFQEITKHIEILNAISTDHSLIHVHFKTSIKFKEDQVSGNLITPELQMKNMW